MLSKIAFRKANFILIVFSAGCCCDDPTHSVSESRTFQTSVELLNSYLSAPSLATLYFCFSRLRLSLRLILPFSVLASSEPKNVSETINSWREVSAKALAADAYFRR